MPRLRAASAEEKSARSRIYAASVFLAPPRSAATMSRKSSIRAWSEFLPFGAIALGFAEGDSVKAEDTRGAFSGKVESGLRRKIRRPTALGLLLGKLVRRNRNGDLARLGVEPGGEQEHAAIGQGGHDADQGQETEQARHD